MTLESTVSRETFVGNGVAVEFPFGFRVWEGDQILVYRWTASGREEDCTSETTISLNDGDAAGGTVTFRTAPEDGVTIAVVRNMPFLQEDVYINGTRFDPHEIEDRFDKDCAERQQLLLGVTQAVKVPNTDSRTSEEYTNDFWDAVDSTLENSTKACDCAARACECADYAESQANRAESAGILGTLAENIDATWTLEEDVAAGTTVELPYWYYPKRNILRLSCDGVEMYLGPQFEEVGDDEETLSNQVTVLIDLRAGMQLHMWVVMSNLGRLVSEVEERLEAAVGTVEDTASDAVDRMESALSDYLDQAEACRDEACECAQAAKSSQEIAENAAVEATEQADRADDAAADAQAASADARKAAVFAHLNRQGRAVGAAREFGTVEAVPSGFWVVNEDLAIEATLQHPVTPLPAFEAIPSNCDGFFVIGPAFERDYPCVNPEPDDGGGDGGGDGGTPTTARNTVMQPCGARQRYSTVY